MIQVNTASLADRELPEKNFCNKILRDKEERKKRAADSKSLHRFRSILSSNCMERLTVNFLDSDRWRNKIQSDTELDRIEWPGNKIPDRLKCRENLQCRSGRDSESNKELETKNLVNNNFQKDKQSN